MSDAASTPRRKTAGALDIRNIIGSLLGIYGIVLVVMGLVGDPELVKTGGINANLYAGIGLAVVAALFLGWARLRPVVVPVHAGSEAGLDDGSSGGSRGGSQDEGGRHEGATGH